MVIVIGEALVDILHAEPHVGGSPLNVAVGVARLGHRTHFVTRVGGDKNGRLVRERLAESDVQIASPHDDAPTSVARVTLDAAGKPTYEFDIYWHLAQVSLPTDLSGDVPFIHTGSIATALQPGADSVRTLLASARHGSVITYDPNCRPSVFPDRRQAVAQVETFVRLSDVVKASDEDLEWLYPGRSIQETLRAWLELGASMAVVTLGENGARAVTSQVDTAVEGLPILVSDTVGAGDSFMAALIDWLARVPKIAQERGWISALSAADVREMLRYAVSAAAVTVSRAGAYPPTRSEITLMMQQHQSTGGGIGDGPDTDLRE